MPRQSQRTWYPARSVHPLLYAETPAGCCSICGVAWPCAEWVEDREAWDAEQEESDSTHNPPLHHSDASEVLEVGGGD